MYRIAVGRLRNLPTAASCPSAKKIGDYINKKNMFTLRWFLGLEFDFARRHYIIVDM